MKQSNLFSPNYLEPSSTLNRSVEDVKNKVFSAINNKNNNLVDHLEYNKESEQLLNNESVQLLLEAINGIESEEVDLDLHKSIHSMRFVITGDIFKDDNKMFEETLANLQHAMEWLGRANLIKDNVPKEYLAHPEFKEMIHEFVLRAVHFTKPEYEAGIKLLTGAAIKGCTPDDFWSMLYNSEDFFEELFINDVIGDNFDKVVERCKSLLDYCKDFNSDSKSVELLTYITLASDVCKKNTKTEYYTDKDLTTLVPLYAIIGIEGMCEPGITLHKLYNYYKAITN